MPEASASLISLAKDWFNCFPKDFSGRLNNQSARAYINNFGSDYGVLASINDATFIKRLATMVVKKSSR